MHDFCLLGADGKTKVVASFREMIHTPVHFRFSVVVESAVIRVLSVWLPSPLCLL